MKSTTKFPPLARTVTITIAALMTVLPCTAQVGDPVVQFRHYAERDYGEKIYVHTDKSVYLCGEIVWFKVYNVDASLHTPSGLSKVAYVELISSEKKAMLQAKIELADGSGHGSIALPFSLNSGVYLLRCYTNWMKNSDASFYFEKEITIINSLKKLPATPAEVPDFNIAFFPEGGNLVEGIETKVAFHATTPYGRGLDCRGVVLNQDNDTIINFSSSRVGMGHFLITPGKNNRYKAIVNAGDLKIEKDLPAVRNAGYSIRLISTAGSDPLKLQVRTTGVQDRSVSLLIHTRNQTKFYQASGLRNGEAEFIVPKDQPGEGISHFTLFNEAGLPVSERLYFRKPKQQMHLDVKINNKKYNTREKIEVDLTAKNNKQEPINTGLSMSVFRVDSLQTLPMDDIVSHLWLKADLRGRVEQPSYYFSSEPGVEAAADDLMLTHGWRRFKWDEVGKGRQIGGYLPEYEGPLVSGKIMERATNLPAKNIPVVLSAIGGRPVFATATSDENGKFILSPGQFYGDVQLLVQTAFKSNKQYSINIDHPFSNSLTQINLSPLRLPAAVAADLNERSIETQVENMFLDDRRQQFRLPAQVDSGFFYGEPDKTYLLDDYTRFITLEEVLREYIAEVRVRKLGDEFTYKVRNGSQNVFFENHPLVLLDGSPVFDLNKLMDYDPLKIKKLDIVTRKFYSGRSGYEGIVSFITYSGGQPGFEKDPQSVIFDYPGVLPEREFYSPRYETEAAREAALPDFRNVLYWSPGITTSKTGEASAGFFSSDRAGRYAVVVQGLDEQGRAGSAVVFFEVSDSRKPPAN